MDIHDLVPDLKQNNVDSSGKNYEKTEFFENVIQKRLESMGWTFLGEYYFNKKMAAFAELGYSIAWLTVGMTFKL